jgi:hypothetical protein
MDTQSDINATGRLDARYSAFLETIVHLRPRLHRYCARMTGSVLDGEDVMQEAVFGVRELASADARLRVAECFAGRLADSPYFVEYERRSIPWRMALGNVDGEPVIIILRDDAGRLTPFSAVRLGVVGGRIVRITDYVNCPWVLEAAGSIAVAEM